MELLPEENKKEQDGSQEPTPHLSSNAKSDQSDEQRRNGLKERERENSSDKSRERGEERNRDQRRGDMQRASAGRSTEQG